MTTIVELLEMGLNQYNAEKVLESYSRRIGTEHGDFTVVDMTYLGNSACDVEMRCRFCGKSLHKTIYTNRSKKTKWCRVQNVCECTKQARKEDTEAKRRLAESIEVQRREEEKRSYIGREYGEYRIVGIDGDSFVGQCKICGRTKNFKIKRIDSRRDFKCKEHRKTVEKYDETYIGQKKNHLTVIGITHDMKTGRKRFICKCDCGEKTLVKPTFWENGHVVSCGCYLAYRSIFTEPRERIFGIWRGMKARCYSERNKSYRNYGARGIKICPEWMDFENFYTWSMANEYDNTKTLDREDWDGNYEPGNCRWTTWDIQCRNKRPRKSQKYYEEMKNGTTNG